MGAVEIIETVSAAGGQLWLDGDKIRARLPESLRPMVATIRECKPELIGLLAQRPAIPPGVRLVSYLPARPPIRISLCETVVDTGGFVQSTLQQLRAKLNGESGWQYGFRSLSEMVERLRAVGCLVELIDRKAVCQ